MKENENNPKHWFLGIFYFNPKDSRIFISKRFPGFGLTLNFGNPFSGLIVIAIIAIIIFLVKTSVN